MRPLIMIIVFGKNRDGNVGGVAHRKWDGQTEFTSSVEEMIIFVKLKPVELCVYLEPCLKNFSKNSGKYIFKKR